MDYTMNIFPWSKQHTKIIIINDVFHMHVEYKFSNLTKIVY